jgi:CheY-like chemotaxis protein
MRDIVGEPYRGAIGDPRVVENTGAGDAEAFGYEVARAIRRLPGADGVTLIALTGWGQDADRDLSHAAGFDYHLIKPVDVQALETLLISVDGDEAGRRTSAARGPRHR